MIPARARCLKKTSEDNKTLSFNSGSLFDYDSIGSQYENFINLQRHIGNQNFGNLLKSRDKVHRQVFIPVDEPELGATEFENESPVEEVLLKQEIDNIVLNNPDYPPIWFELGHSDRLNQEDIYNSQTNHEINKSSVMNHIYSIENPQEWMIYVYGNRSEESGEGSWLVAWYRAKYVADALKVRLGPLIDIGQIQIVASRKRNVQYSIPALNRSVEVVVLHINDFSPTDEHIEGKDIPLPSYSPECKYSDILYFERGIEKSKEWLHQAYEICRNVPINSDLETAINFHFNASTSDLEFIRLRVLAFLGIISEISQEIVCTDRNNHENCENVKAFVPNYRPPIFYCMDTMGNNYFNNSYLADLVIHEVAHAYFSDLDVIYFHDVDKPFGELKLRYTPKDELLNNADSWSSFIKEIVSM